MARAGADRYRASPVRPRCSCSGSPHRLGLRRRDCSGGSLAGAFAPPITVLTRTMWRHRFDDADARKTAFALDSVLVELAFTLGPALIALLLAVGSPTIAFGAAFAFTAIAVPTFLASPALALLAARAARGTSSARAAAPSRDSRRVRYDVPADRAASACSRSAIPALRRRRRKAPAGRRASRDQFDRQRHRWADLRRRCISSCAPNASCAAARALVVPLAHPCAIILRGALAVMAFVAGLLIAPTLTMVTVLVSTYAPSRYATEAFTWSATCIISGIGAGNALGGVLLERFDPLPSCSAFVRERGAAGGRLRIDAACAVGPRAGSGRPSRPMRTPMRSVECPFGFEEPAHGDSHDDALRRGHRTRPARRHARRKRGPVAAADGRTKC